MQEEYLHYLFKQKYFGRFFVTSKGETVEVIEHGRLNTNAGPDFLEAKIKFDGKIWAGPIEFHVKSSDWIKHKHQFDSAYNNVIAHFVYENDLAIFTNQFELPTIELKNFINNEHFEHYKKFKNNKSWVACANQIQSVDPFIIYQQKEVAFFNRMMRKSTAILIDFDLYQGDELKIMLHALAKVFGGKVNHAPFVQLAKKINWQHLSRFNNDLKAYEAYCFGLAGFLNFEEALDKYANELQSNYLHFKKLFDLVELNGNEWKFSRMHPPGFPTIRIAQFASLLKLLFTNGIGNITWANLDALEITLSEYWQQHYHFAKKHQKNLSGLSKDFKNLLYINAYIPFLFAKGTLLDQPSLKEFAFDAMNLVTSEKNSIISNWSKLGVKSKTAFDSQALIELKNEFCQQQKCLNCKIGQNIIGLT